MEKVKWDPETALLHYKVGATFEAIEPSDSCENPTLSQISNHNSLLIHVTYRRGAH